MASSSISAFGEHCSSDQLTTVTFDWPIAGSGETYTIAPTTTLSLELDKHFPIRLARIALCTPPEPGSLELISDLTTPEIEQATAEAPTSGEFFLRFSIGLASRILLARLQLTSPSTPPAIKRACTAMLAANATPTPASYSLPHHT